MKGTYRYFGMYGHNKYETDVEEMLDGMNVHELAEILVYLVGTDEEINELVENALKKESAEKPYSATLRHELSLLIDGTSDSYDDAEDHMDLLGVFSLEDHIRIKYKGKEADCRYCRDALEKAVSACPPHEAFRNVLLLWRMLKRSGNWKLLTVLAELQKEYLPRMIAGFLSSLDDQDREMLIGWGVEYEDDEDYGLLASGFLKAIEDESHLKILKDIRMDCFREYPYFDIDVFRKLASVMVELRDWDELTKLCRENLDEWDVSKIMGDMYFGRKMYDEALKYYKIYYDQLFRNGDWSCADDLLDFLDEHISCFSDTETLREMYESAVFDSPLSVKYSIQILYRLTPVEGKEDVKRRFIERYSHIIDDDYLFHAFSTDEDIMAAYFKGGIPKKNLLDYCYTLKSDWLAFSHKPEDVKAYASLVEKAFYEILTAKDLECKYPLGDALDDLVCKMGEVGRAEVGRIVGRLPEITMFYDELDEHLSDFDWYSELKH